MQSVILYTKDNCPWCDLAKGLLNDHGVTNIALFTVGRDYDPAQFKILAASNGWSPATVPMIFYRKDDNKGWVFLGGYEKLKEYYKDDNV